MIKKRTISTGILFLFIFSLVLLITHEVSHAKPDLGNLRVPFVPNEGQIDDNVKFYARTFVGTISITERGELIYSAPNSPPARAWQAGKPPTCSAGRRTPNSFTFKEQLVGGRINELKPAKESKAKVSYFHGSDPRKWKSGLKTYEEVSLEEAYEGIELKLRAYGNNVEKLFRVKPGADPNEIRMKLSGVRNLKVKETGELEVETDSGRVKFTKPIAFQEIDGKRKEVRVAYHIQKSESSLQDPEENSAIRNPNFAFMYSFNVGPYDKEKPLIIDPLLQSTYIGGNGSETGHAMAIHPTTGDIYVTGVADGQVFVSRLSSDLTTLLQTTSLGGSDWDEAYGIAIHPDTGDVYITGYTTSTDFPGLTGAADTTFAGYNEAFVSRLSSDLITLYQSTFLGGVGYEVAYGVAIHPNTGDVYVTGVTNSTNFPNITGGADTTIVGDEAFVSRLSRNLRTIYQSTFLGGSKYDSGSAIAIHPTSGDIYVTGTTGSSDFPGIAGGADTTFAADEAFVSRLSLTLRTLYQSTFLGGSGDDSGFGIAIHPTQGIYVTGHTFSNNFPGIADGADTTFAGSEAFVSRLSFDLKTLLQSTYLGGSDDDVGLAIAVHPTTGDVYVTGYTASSDFPGITNGADTMFAGSEAFVSRLSGSLIFLYQSTFLGGRSADTGVGIAIHPTTGRIYVTGSTGSSDFPKIAGGADTTFSDWTFATETIDTGTDGDDTQTDLGTSANNFILQYGKGGNDTQYISGADGNDWTEQYGGAGNDNQTAGGGTGNDYLYQSGGTGDDTMVGSGDDGNDWIFQSGGIGKDDLAASGGLGNDYIYQSGGTGDDTMRVDAGEGDDLVIIDAGPGNDTITYDVSAGADTVFIDGGTGNDTLTINAGTQNFTLKNEKGVTLFSQGTGGTEIWVRSVENITVLDPNKIPKFEITDATDITGGPDTSYLEIGLLGEAFVAMFDNLSSLYTLTVTKTGNGSGTVTGPGISCGFNCREAYTPNTLVTLTATANTDSTFVGWSGDPDCSDGQVTMNADKTCTATFNLLLGLPDLSGTWVTLTSSDGGKSVSGTLAVKNNGAVNAGTFKVAFYLSDDGSTFGNLLKTNIVRRGVGAGATKNISFSFRSRRTSLSGKYVIALIDSDNSVIESDENNNRAAAGIP
jgi:CARDB/Divergent InlB B-repeat domain